MKLAKDTPPKEKQLLQSPWGELALLQHPFNRDNKALRLSLASLQTVLPRVPVLGLFCLQFFEWMLVHSLMLLRSQNQDTASAFSSNHDCFQTVSFLK